MKFFLCSLVVAVSLWQGQWPSFNWLQMFYHILCFQEMFTVLVHNLFLTSTGYLEDSPFVFVVQMDIRGYFHMQTNFHYTCSSYKYTSITGSYAHAICVFFLVSSSDKILGLMHAALPLSHIHSPILWICSWKFHACTCLDHIHPIVHQYPQLNSLPT